MRALLILFALIFVCPVQASALDLKPLVKEIFRATDTVQFTDFRMLDRRNGQYDWFVTLTNNGNQTLARNQYELQTYQVDRLGKRYEASGDRIMDKDIPPGKSLYLQLPFTPHRDISKLGFVFVSKRNNVVVGKREFDARSAAAGPAGQQDKVTKPAVTAAETAGQAAFTPVDLKLQLKELDRNKFELHVTNRGSEKVDLRHYVFSAIANMLMRPNTRTDFTFDTTTLSPGRTARSRVRQIEGTACANLDSFTLVARGRNNGMRFEDMQPVEAYDVRVQPIAIEVEHMDRGIDEYSSVEIVLEVKNYGTRNLTDAELSGKMFFKAKSASAPEFVLDLGRIYSAGFPLKPGQKKRMHFVIRVGTLADHGMLVQQMYMLHGRKPLVIEFRGRLGSPSNCGVPVFYDDVQIDEEFRKAN